MRGKQLGKIGELAAVRYLRNKGYQIIERNYSSKYGEIDIIALEDGDLVFVEVKTRRGESFGLPEEAVDQRKIRHIKRAAFSYTDSHFPRSLGLRIDVVSVQLSPEERLENVRIFRNVS
ncbi:MAG TPA: YraN family protein [Candidatus Bathyarchaeia archaeon]|nr:YraN family protein [Candidatus Bathyarchaeia archaeon]